MGEDSNAKAYFDGLWKYFRQYQSGINPGLMAWKQTNCRNVEGADSATDGDLDAAYGLILAAARTHEDSYLMASKQLLEAIKKSEFNSDVGYPTLGDWATGDATFGRVTRGSDFMPANFRVFYSRTEDEFWNKAIEYGYGRW